MYNRSFHNLKSSCVWGNLHKPWKNSIYIGIEILCPIWQGHTWGSTWMSRTCPFFTWPHCLVVAFKPLPGPTITDACLDSKTACQAVSAQVCMGLLAPSQPLQAIFLLNICFAQGFCFSLSKIQLLGNCIPPKY